LIIPDLPYEESAELRPIAQSHGIDLITLVAPTSEERIRKIAAGATGFVYVVSSMGVTGVRSEITTDLGGIVGHVKAATNGDMDVQSTAVPPAMDGGRLGGAVPTAVGFGINTPEQAARIAQIADGVIVGSAIVRIVAEHGDAAAAPVAEYVRAMKAAITP
jgi:tryptophan synthase alpha chain